MRSHKRLTAVALSVAVTGIIAVPQQASAATGTTLYVDNSSTACTDSGTGTQAAPYCTIQAAADAATAGATVLVASSGDGYNPYNENLQIKNSGTATAPITFKAVAAKYDLFGTTSLTVSGNYIDISGMAIGGSELKGPSIQIDGSHVTLDHIQADGNTKPTVVASSNVSDLTIERSFLISAGDMPSVQLSSGDSGVVLTTNVINIDGGVPTTAAVVVNGATGTDIASNTISSNNMNGIQISGSTGTSVENNVVSGNDWNNAAESDLIVDSASSTSTTVGYNLYSILGALTAYSWAGKTYSTQSAFTAATGQGTGDVVQSTVDLSTDAISTSDPAINSANSDAPGELATDVYGNAWPDNPSVPNTGVGTYTYYDRGAVAFEEFTGATLYASSDSPQRVGVNLDLQGAAWGTSLSGKISWGDGTADSDIGANPDQTFDFSDLLATHMYAKRGTYTVTATFTDSTQTITRTATVSTYGSTYVPVTPTRVLDTRNDTGTSTGKIGPDGSVAVNVTNAVAGAPAASTVTAVVMNVTATDPTAAGFITAYPDGGALPNASNLNFAPNETVPNLVTVKVGADGKVALRSSSTGSTDLVADVQGYYVDSGSGSYYSAESPKRLLDTRNGTGAPSAPVAPGGTVKLTINGCTAPATAVALNVTVTQPTSNGFITVYPDGGAVPAASNVNYAKGETVPNLVTVKVGTDNEVDLHNTSSGTVEIIADAEGCYTTTDGGAFVPLDPKRVLDTRTAIGQETSTGIPAAANGNALWFASDVFSVNFGESAVVMNVTVTNPQANGFITAYPANTSLPNASNLNFAKNETVPNLIMVAVDSNNDVSLHNTSNGTTNLIADLFGYFS